MTILAVRKIHFCYGHRVMGHENKCGSLHGHNGVLWIHAKAIGNLDNLGRVIDFSVIKDTVGAWVDEHWDHTMIIFKDGKVVGQFVGLTTKEDIVAAINKQLQ